MNPSHQPSTQRSEPTRQVLPGEVEDLRAISFPQRIKQALSAVGGWVYGETLEGILVNLKGLAGTYQILTLLGYLAVIALLMVTLLVEVLGPDQPKARFIIPSSSFWVSQPELAKLIGQSLSLPWLALAGILLAFALGWTYLLSGATDSRRRIFLPILLVFVFQLFLTFPVNIGELSAAQQALVAVRCLCLPALLAVLAAGFGFSYRSPRWQKLAWLKWLAILGLLLGILVSLVLLNPKPESLVFNLVGLLGGPFLLAIPWWIVSGLTGVDLVMRIARFVLSGVRRLFPSAFLQKGSIFVTLGHPLLAGLFLFVYIIVDLQLHPEMNSENYATGVLNVALMLETLLGVVLVLILVGLLISKHWTEQNALVLLALNLAMPFFSLTLCLAFYQGSSLFDLVELATNPLAELAPMLTFVILMAYSALSLSTEFANKDGVFMPRRARVQFGLGAALLIIAFTLFFANLSISNPGQGEAGEVSALFIDTDQMSTDINALSLIFLGFPFLLWAIRKDPERILGDAPSRPAILAGLDTQRGRTLTAVIFGLLTLLGLCLCCCANLFLIF